MSLFEGTSVLIGSAILVPVLMADFSRFIYNDRESFLSVLGLTIGTPLVYLISAIIAIQTGEVDIIDFMNEKKPAFDSLFYPNFALKMLTIAMLCLRFLP